MPLASTIGNLEALDARTERRLRGEAGRSMQFRGKAIVSLPDQTTNAAELGGRIVPRAGHDA